MSRKAEILNRLSKEDREYLKDKFNELDLKILDLEEEVESLNCALEDSEEKAFRENVKSKIDLLDWLYCFVDDQWLFVRKEGEDLVDLKAEGNNDLIAIICREIDKVIKDLKKELL